MARFPTGGDARRHLGMDGRAVRGWYPDPRAGALAAYQRSWWIIGSTGLRRTGPNFQVGQPR